jgi:transposase-like protein
MANLPSGLQARSGSLTSGGVKFWLRVMNELRDRGVQDILIAMVDGLKGGGFPEAIAAAFPKTQVQACVVHLIRSSLDFVSYKDRKTVAAALREVYRARDAEAERRRWRPSMKDPGAANTPPSPKPGGGIGRR